MLIFIIINQHVWCAHTHTHMHTPTQKHTQHTHMHTPKQGHMHTHTHAHTYIKRHTPHTDICTHLNDDTHTHLMCTHLHKGTPTHNTNTCHPSICCCAPMTPLGYRDAGNQVEFTLMVMVWLSRNICDYEALAG